MEGVYNNNKTNLIRIWTGFFYKKRDDLSLFINVFHFIILFWWFIKSTKKLIRRKGERLEFNNRRIHYLWFIVCTYVKTDLSSAYRCNGLSPTVFCHLPTGKQIFLIWQGFQLFFCLASDCQIQWVNAKIFKVLTEPRRIKHGHDDKHLWAGGLTRRHCLTIYCPLAKANIMNYRQQPTNTLQCTNLLRKFSE